MALGVFVVLSRFVVALLLLACTSCSVAVAGAPVPDSAVVKALAEPLTAREALGDFPTVNYCSLVHKDDFPTDLGGVVVFPAPYLDACAFTVRTKYGDVSVEVGRLGDPDTLRGVSRTLDPHQIPPRGLEVQRGYDGSETCEEFLMFADDLVLAVRAEALADDNEPAGGWCPVADATMKQVIATVIAKKVGHFTFQDRSAGKIDACDLLTVDLVTAQLAQPDTRALTFPARHTCRWGAGSPGGTAVTLELTPVHSGIDLSVATQETIAGQATYLTPWSGGGRSVCTATTYLMSSPVLGAQETAVLEVSLSEKGKDACAIARALAGHAWQKLP